MSRKHWKKRSLTMLPPLPPLRSWSRNQNAETTGADGKSSPHQRH
jgi:hypothetical protein